MSGACPECSGSGRDGVGFSCFPCNGTGENLGVDHTPAQRYLARHFAESPRYSVEGALIALAEAGVAGPVVGSTGADWQVVAWAVFAPNGNIRLWSTDREEVRQFAVKQELPLTPLYRKVAGTKESA